MLLRTCLMLVVLVAALEARTTTGLSLAAPESEQQKVIRLAKALEEQPLSQEAPEARKWLITWITESPDVTVTICDLLGPIPSQELPYGPELLIQMMFSNAAFQLANPDKRDDTLAVQLAGVNGTLQAYQSIVKEHPEARISYFDDLIAKQHDGSFKVFMAPVVSKECSATGA